MIEVMQGSLGSGKSAAAVARAIMHLRSGGVVAANFGLVDGWADTIAKQYLWARFDDDYRYEKACSLWERFFNVQSLDAILKIKPREIAIGKHAPDGKYKEGVGLLVLDEAHMFMNPRKWQNNLPWIEFFSQARKIGWDVLLISHSIEMIDSQIRNFCEYESRFRNLQKVKIPILGLPFSPFPLFLVIRRYAGISAGAGVVADRDLYPLPLWAAQLYDSLHIFSTEQFGETKEPLFCGKPPAPPLCGGVGLPKKPEFKSSLDPGCLWSKWEKHEYERASGAV